MRAIETKVWACSSCKRWSEDLAVAEACCTCRSCGVPCDPRDMYWCEACKAKDREAARAADRARHEKLTPVAVWDYALCDGPEDVIEDGDHAIEVAQENLQDEGIEKPTREQIQAEIESWMLVPSQPGTLPEFDVRDFLYEHMPEDWEAEDAWDLMAAEAVLNKAIRELKTVPLVPIKGQRVDVGALMNECWKGAP